jgi:hypothetical protein
MPKQKPVYKHSFQHLLNVVIPVEQLPETISWTEPVKEPNTYNLKYENYLTPNSKLS